MSARTGKETAKQNGKSRGFKAAARRSRRHHGGHHGGAWKVAYADFVTAMMALFIVLWIMSTSDKKLKADIARYFRDPGVFTGARGIVNNGEHASGNAMSMEELQSYIQRGLSELNALRDILDQIPITITPEGLLIEILDKDKRAFFEIGSATVKPVMRQVLQVVVEAIARQPYKLTISGHTDSRPYHDASFYSNWELSSARALNTRRTLEELGLTSDRFEQVISYGDRKLRVPDDPLNSENRRISILIGRAAAPQSPQ